MALTTLEIVRYMQHIQDVGAASSLSSLDVLRSLIQQSLGPQERRLFALVALRPDTTTVELRERTGLPLNHIGTVLGRLRAYGLVEKVAHSHESGGVFYTWSPADWPVVAEVTV